MPTVVLKLFAVQGNGRMDRRTKRQLYASPFVEHNKAWSRSISDHEFNYVVQHTWIICFALAHRQNSKVRACTNS